MSHLLLALVESSYRVQPTARCCTGALVRATRHGGMFLYISCTHRSECTCTVCQILGSWRQGQSGLGEVLTTRQAIRADHPLLLVHGRMAKRSNLREYRYLKFLLKEFPGPEARVTWRRFHKVPGGGARPTLT